MLKRINRSVNIAENILKYRSLVPEGVEIVAVSKFHPAEMILEAYEVGQRLFGESRVQEFLEKEKVLPKDIRWHFIGHLQTNKVRQIIGKTSMIESIDSERLLELIDRESEKSGVVTNVLLQVHVASEEAKFGFFPEELREFFRNKGYDGLKFVRICGLMGMATNTEDLERVRSDFHVIRDLYDELKPTLPEAMQEYFRYVSMGMSGDWPIAVEEGANIVRIGSAIFGERV